LNAKTEVAIYWPEAKAKV